jgi:hypothetical protein
MATMLDQLAARFKPSATAAPLPPVDNSAPDPVQAAPTPPGPPAPWGPATADDAPRKLDAIVLADLARTYEGILLRYKGERQPVELRWLRNLRQVMGIYDPEIEKILPANRSRAYPRLTRTKCLQLLARVMNLMFPGNDKNWTVGASVSPEMDPADVAKAVADLITKMQAAGMPTQLTQDLITTAVKTLADTNAKLLSDMIEDQLGEMGSANPDDKLDWVALNRKIIDSGIKYGIGVMEGPFVRTVQQSGWELIAPPTPMVPGQAPDPSAAQPGFQPVSRTIYKPLFNHVPVWDFYPDMTSRNLPGDGYFIRKIMSAHKLKKLKKRPDFQSDQIDELLRMHPNGNYNALWWETELRSMGVAINADKNSNVTANRNRFEVIVFRGAVDATMLAKAGVEIEDTATADDIFVEMWMCSGIAIKLEVDPWRKLGETTSQIHVYSFDEDDTSPIGQGLPYMMRDSQMSICAATRMALDNASVVCGPNLEVNKALLDPSQDLTGVTPYKVWVRNDDGQTAAYPAVREIQINSHLSELTDLIQLFEGFSENETFINSGNGGDLSNMPSEPMRTMAGASMVNGNVALPFKDMVRNYDTFTQSAISALVVFNQVFNPTDVPTGDYNIIARGATSLIAKEVRGAALDNLAVSMTPEDAIHVDRRKMISERLETRDLSDILRPMSEVEMDQAKQAQEAAEQKQMQEAAITAQTGKTQADGYKAATQGQANVAKIGKTNVEAATHLMQAGNLDEPQPDQSAGAPPAAQ